MHSNKVCGMKGEEEGNKVKRRRYLNFYHQLVEDDDDDDRQLPRNISHFLSFNAELLLK